MTEQIIRVLSCFLLCSFVFSKMSVMILNSTSAQHAGLEILKSETTHAQWPLKEQRIRSEEVNESQSKFC
jgi:hypothetical protein